MTVVHKDGRWCPPNVSGHFLDLSKNGHFNYPSFFWWSCCLQNFLEIDCSRFRYSSQLNWSHQPTDFTKIKLSWECMSCVGTFARTRGFGYCKYWLWMILKKKYSRVFCVKHRIWTLGKNICEWCFNRNEKYGAHGWSLSLSYSINKDW